MEALITFSSDGRAQPWLAESLSRSDDGLKVRFKLRPSVRFHDGREADAALIRDALIEQLPRYLGSVSADIETITAEGRGDLVLTFRRRSNFVFEGLDVAIQTPRATPGAFPIGTGPFAYGATTGGLLSLDANPGYHEGTPLIDHLEIKPYTSVRSAWADMLRGEVDMLYEVGIDALGSLEQSNAIKVFPHQRNYAYVVILNTRKPELADSRLRRELNEAMDRSALIADALGGHARPATGPVWPSHWAYDRQLPTFAYRPVRVAKPITITCLFPDASLERMLLKVQQQLGAVGVEFKLDLLPLDQFVQRVQSGNFDAVLADAVGGPTMVRPSWFWRSGGPYNWAKYSNERVDAALDAIRDAPDDPAYKAGVAAFQRAIIDDPPAIFLAWSERARAVSTRFDVPVEPGRDILSTLRLWRPVADPRMRSPN
jgi:peptide/nickel transport system substrate-binding protein